jgi:hypothetical protein
MNLHEYADHWQSHVKKVKLVEAIYHANSDVLDTEICVTIRDEDDEFRTFSFPKRDLIIQYMTPEEEIIFKLENDL